jgi:hypothetical protein
MLAIIGYLALATLMSALANLIHSKKGRLWDWVGNVPFFASLIFSVAFGTQLIHWIPHPSVDSMQTRIVFDLIGVVIFIMIGTVTSYVAGGVLFSEASAYAESRRGKPQEAKVNHQ